MTTSLGAQGTVCAGGRYDGLWSSRLGRAAPAVGFAMGLERLVLLVQAVNRNSGAVGYRRVRHLFRRGHQGAAMQLAEQVRDARRS